jgi:hypothetical protein
VVLEGSWPGPLDRWNDESNLGKYYSQVLDRATNRLIYSRGSVVGDGRSGRSRHRPQPAPRLNIRAVVENGPPRDKADLLLLGDGYTAAEIEKWHRDARRTVALLFAASPFKEHRRDFNLWAIDTPAEESGMARPSHGAYRHSPLRASYDAFGSER